MNDVEDELQKLRIVHRLRTREGWYETSESDELGQSWGWRGGASHPALPGYTLHLIYLVALADVPSGPYAKFDPQKVHNSLTAGSLRGPGKLAVPPILFAKSDESEAIGE